MPSSLKPVWFGALLTLATLSLPLSAAEKDSDAANAIGRYSLPERGDVVGQVRRVKAAHEDTLIDIGHRYGIGYEEMRRANPEVSVWLPGEGTEIVLPTRHVLPPGPREGVVVNVAEMRLYYYPPMKQGETPRVETYPVSVGRMDWKTPMGETTIVAKAEDPAWYPPSSIIKEHAEDGRALPRVVPPGPDNPLGRHALRLGIPGYLIHGTNRPEGVGMRVTHGCIRMLPEDIDHLFTQLPKGTQVRLINAPMKMGWTSEGVLLMQVYPPLDDPKNTTNERMRRGYEAVANFVGKRDYLVDFALVGHLLAALSGMAEPVALLDQTFTDEDWQWPQETLYERLLLREALYSHLQTLSAKEKDA